MEYRIFSLSKVKTEKLKLKIETEPNTRKEWLSFRDEYKKFVDRTITKGLTRGIIDEKSEFARQVLLEAYQAYQKHEQKELLEHRVINNEILGHYYRKIHSTWEKRESPKNSNPGKGQGSVSLEGITTYKDDESLYDLADKVIADLARDPSVDPRQLQEITGLWKEIWRGPEIAHKVWGYILRICKNKTFRNSKKGYKVMYLVCAKGMQEVDVAKINDTDPATVRRHMTDSIKRIEGCCREMSRIQRKKS